MTKTKIAIAIIFALVVGIISGYYVASKNTSLVGGSLAENYNPYLRTNGGFQTNLPITIGSSGTAINSIILTNAASCTASSSVAKSSTATEECAVSGVLSTDKVFVTATTTASNVSLSLIDAFASTTANGYVDFVILNASTSAITSSQNDVRNATLLIFR